MQKIRLLLAMAVSLASPVLLAASSPEPEVIGGRAVDWARSPEAVQLVVLDGTALCTGTVVGPQVVLTAGHCAREGESILVKFVDGSEQHAVCANAPGANAEGDGVDMNLCVLERAVSLDFASVSVDAGPANSDEVTLSGFGCTKADRTGGNNGVLRQGNARVIEQPNPFDFTTDRGAVVCPGDSGGATFLAGSKTVVGVNSKVECVQGTGCRKLGTKSFLAATFTPEAAGFFRSFAADKFVAICGVNADCGG